MVVAWWFVFVFVCCLMFGVLGCMRRWLNVVGGVLLWLLFVVCCVLVVVCSASYGLVCWCVVVGCWSLYVVCCFVFGF